MQRSLRDALLVLLFVGTCLFGAIASAETGFLVVHVEDVQGHPVAGLEIGVKGDGGSAKTDSKGKARIALAPQTKEKTSVSLQIVKSPSGQDLVMVSPWDYRAQVPSFENESDNFVEVVIVQRGDRAALESGTVLKAAVSQINKANFQLSAETHSTRENPIANLEAVAKQYGLSTEDMNKAIKAWGAKTADLYEAGLAALYSQSYEKATLDLQTSLDKREEKLASDQNAVQAVANDQKDVADAAFFLGQSLYQQGKYKESAAKFQRCLQIRPDDPVALNNTALSRQKAGDYPGAEVLFRRALAIDEKALGMDHPEVATNLNNLGELLRAKGDYAGAEPLYRRALAIDEKALGPNHPYVANNLNNLGELLRAKGDYAGAEPLYRRALAIDEKALGPDHPNVAKSLNNLASLLEDKSDYAGAEALCRRALAINEKALGPDHPDVATSLNNLASLLEDKSDYTGAEALYRRAPAINEKALGPDHPNVATCLNNLALMLQAKADYSAAAPLFRRALAIDEKALGADQPSVAIDLNNLALLLYTKGDYAGAEPLIRRAVAIDEKTLGPDHPTTRLHQENLDELLQKMAQTTPPKAQN
jgi:tetratricopeptide (TPR) repeat protein